MVYLSMLKAFLLFTSIPTLIVKNYSLSMVYRVFQNIESHLGRGAVTSIVNPNFYEVA